MFKTKYYKNMARWFKECWQDSITHWINKMDEKEKEKTEYILKRLKVHKLEADGNYMVHIPRASPQSMERLRDMWRIANMPGKVMFINCIDLNVYKIEEAKK